MNIRAGEEFETGGGGGNGLADALNDDVFLEGIEDQAIQAQARIAAQARRGGVRQPAAAPTAAPAAAAAAASLASAEKAAPIAEPVKQKPRRQRQAAPAAAEALPVRPAEQQKAPTSAAPAAASAPTVEVYEQALPPILEARGTDISTKAPASAHRVGSFEPVPAPLFDRPRDERDDLTRQLGARHYQIAARLPWCRSISGQYEFSRYYFPTPPAFVGRVLVDVFPVDSRAVRAEVAEKTELIRRYNAEHPDDPFGYIPSVRGAYLAPDVLERGSAGGIFSLIGAGRLQAVG